MHQQQRLRLAGIIASIAGLLGAVGDLLLFYVPGFSTDIFVVQAIPDWRILSGFLLAILVIPFLALGYWAISRYLTVVNQTLADLVFIGGIYGIGIGNAIHGLTGALVQFVQREDLTASNVEFAATFARFAIPLYGLFYIIMAVGSIVLAWAILRHDIGLPRWLLVFLPIVPNVLIFLVILVAPAVGDVLAPSIANLSHAVLFGLTTFVIWNKLPKERDTHES